MKAVAPAGERGTHWMRRLFRPTPTTPVVALPAALLFPTRMISEAVDHPSFAYQPVMMPAVSFICAKKQQEACALGNDGCVEYLHGPEAEAGAIVGGDGVSVCQPAGALAVKVICLAPTLQSEIRA